LTLKDIGLGEKKPAFKNVIVNGLILAEDGKKLSKKLRNYVAPEVIFAKFGADALRYLLLASTQIGDDYIVSERRIEEVYRRVISTLWHALTFFETYSDKTFKPEKNYRPKVLLDRWIVSRLNHLSQKTTAAMDSYQLSDAARLLDSFVDDLSNWFIRRSRRRFQKPETEKEKNEAEQTLYYVLLNLAKLAAPFIPFLSEEIYLRLTTNYKLPALAKKESVHLCDWPITNKKLINEALEEKMTLSRQIVALALAQRAAAGIKVRQPLASLRIKNDELKVEKQLLELIKDELNVKEIIFDANLKTEMKLDKRITKELKEEGMARELVRQIQDMRKQNGLTRNDRIAINFQLSAASLKLKKFLEKWQSFVLKETFSRIAEDIKNFKPDLEKDLDLGEGKIKIGIKKIK